ncbi:MAG: ComF family protein [Spirochaetia bacterium]|nr:ComF family protein [Spirochaetia bacterium]
MKRFLSSFRNGLLSVFYPTPCAGCGRYIKDFTYSFVCTQCYESIKHIDSSSCPVCAKLIHSEHADGCSECRRRGNKFSYIRAAAQYNGAMRELIRYTKFYNKASLAGLLAGLILERVEPGIFEGIDIIVAVPLSKRSLSERGYNQTRNVAKYLSKASGIPLTEAVRKVRDTPAQNRLDREERRKNLKGAFEVSGNVDGKRVLIVDDVFTTGSTINEMASVLTAAGAIEARGVVVARSV